jgi:hypothetical protein
MNSFKLTPAESGRPLKEVKARGVALHCRHLPQNCCGRCISDQPEVV